jgi:hypothetical protein
MDEKIFFNKYYNNLKVWYNNMFENNYLYPDELKDKFYKKMNDTITVKDLDELYNNILPISLLEFCEKYRRDKFRITDYHKWTNDVVELWRCLDWTKNNIEIPKKLYNNFYVIKFLLTHLGNDYNIDYIIGKSDIFKDKYQCNKLIYDCDGYGFIAYIQTPLESIKTNEDIIYYIINNAAAPYSDISYIPPIYNSIPVKFKSDPHILAKCLSLMHLHDTLYGAPKFIQDNLKKYMNLYNCTDGNINMDDIEMLNFYNKLQSEIK